MNPLEKSRLIRVMKNISDAVLFILIVLFVLTLTSRYTLFVVSGYEFYIGDEYKDLNVAAKTILTFLVSGKIALLSLIMYRLRVQFIFAGFVVLVVAAIFRHGAEMYREQQLTV